MSDLTKKRVHWKEYNGEELVHDEDVDVLTSASAVSFSDGETLQHKYTQGQFVHPSTTGILSNLSTLNKSSLVDAVNEVKTSATSNKSSINTLSGRVTTTESDIDSLETSMTTAESDIDNLETKVTTLESDIDSVETRVSTAENDIDSVETRMTTAENDIDNLESSKAVATIYTATLSTTWTGISSPYTQTVEVSGITSNDTPIIDVVLSSTKSTALEQLEAWSCISTIETGTNQIIVTCLEDKPIVEIPIQIKVVE